MFGLAKLAEEEKKHHPALAPAIGGLAGAAVGGSVGAPVAGKLVDEYRHTKEVPYFQGKLERTKQRQLRNAHEYLEESEQRFIEKEPWLREHLPPEAAEERINVWRNDLEEARQEPGRIEQEIGQRLQNIKNDPEYLKGFNHYRQWMDEKYHIPELGRAGGAIGLGLAGAGIGLALEHHRHSTEKTASDGTIYYDQYPDLVKLRDDELKADEELEGIRNEYNEGEKKSIRKGMAIGGGIGAIPGILAGIATKDRSLKLPVGLVGGAIGGLATAALGSGIAQHHFNKTSPMTPKLNEAINKAQSAQDAHIERWLDIDEENGNQFS